jgi:hypothetical protein
MKIHLLYFAGCPNLDRARDALREALAAEGIDSDVDVDEIDIHDPGAPAWARGWGSPTILIDGADVAGLAPASASSCRLYAGGAPGVDAIRKRIRSA